MYYSYGYNNIKSGCAVTICSIKQNKETARSGTEDQRNRVTHSACAFASAVNCSFKIRFNFFPVSLQLLFGWQHCLTLLFCYRLVLLDPTLCWRAVRFSTLKKSFPKLKNSENCLRLRYINKYFVLLSNKLNMYANWHFLLMLIVKWQLGQSISCTVVKTPNKCKCTKVTTNVLSFAQRIKRYKYVSLGKWLAEHHANSRNSPVLRDTEQVPQ